MAYADDLDALWRTIYGEAEPGDELDALAIGWTILNRVPWDNWPGTVRGVCYQPWQYSCWNADNPRLSHLHEVEKGASDWTRHCHDLAVRLLSDDPPDDPTDGATHYYATYISEPKWVRGKTPTLETSAGKVTHRFYNDIDTPPPQSAKEALEQSRPLSETRTAKGGQVAAGAGAIAVISGAIAELAPALPVLRQAAELIRDNGTGMLVALGAAALAGVGWTLYARWDDRDRGLR